MMNNIVDSKLQKICGEYKIVFPVVPFFGTPFVKEISEVTHDIFKFSLWGNHLLVS